MFVERVLPNSVIRKLSEDEMAAYRKPFARAGEDRRPTLTWPRMIPIEGKPADVVKVVESYAAWLANADVPKLFHQCRSRFGSSRQAAGALPGLVEPDRSDCERTSFPPGRIAPMTLAAAWPTSFAGSDRNDVDRS
jgi:hypothetical protein